MRSISFIVLGVVSATVAASVACSGGNKVQSSSSAGTGGGTGGMTTTTTTTTITVKDAGMDVDNGMVSNVYPAPHPGVPQIAYLGGPVLNSPKLVPVFFADEDPMIQPKLVDFVNKIGGTMYFAAATAEYNVNPAKSLPPVVLTEKAPAQTDDSAIQSWLAAKLNANDPAWPAPDANTLYILHYPSTTGITQQTAMGLQVSCQNFGGYHNSTTLDAMHGTMDVAYAVIPQCAQFYPASAPGTPQPHFTGLDAITGPESHEIMEAVTDPYPMANPAYVQPDGFHLYWFLAAGGGENGDMCQTFPRAFLKLVELPYEIQRTWSNTAAQAGHDPCVPETPGEVYFNTVPVLKDSIKVAGLGTMRGVHIPVGTSSVVELDLFSEADTGGPWNVSVLDLSQPSTLDFSLDRASGQNGEKLHLTITANAKTTQGFALFQIISSLGQTTTLYFGLVGT
jgi:hypothetical protein